MITTQQEKECSCVTYNDALGEWEEAPECWGDCNETEGE